MKELHICLMDNGMVMVFDNNGQQVPALQGEREVAAERIAIWVRVG